MKYLHEAGLRGRLPIFISKFITDRKCSVRVGGTLSALYNQKEGVPRGCILSVTLFSLQINSNVECLTLDCLVVPKTMSFLSNICMNVWSIISERYGHVRGYVIQCRLGCFVSSFIALITNRTWHPAKFHIFVSIQ